MIKDLRMQLNLTQKDVARLVEVSEATISRAENNSGFVSSKTKEKIINQLKLVAENQRVANLYHEINDLLEENDKIIEKHKEEIKTELKEAKERWWKKFCKWN